MKNRSRDYYRKMRAKHIKRKKNIVSHWHGFEDGYYEHDGMYSKNKIHCSCRMCRSKDYNGKHVLTLKELKSLDMLKEELQLYNDSFGTDYEITPKTITTYSICSGDYSTYKQD